MPFRSCWGVGDGGVEPCRGGGGAGGERAEVPPLARAPCRGRGAAGLVDRRMGKLSPRRAAVGELQRMLRLDHAHYAGFAIRHFHDTLRRRHGYKLGYTTTRLWLQRGGAVGRRPGGVRTAGSGRAGRWSA